MMPVGKTGNATRLALAPGILTILCALRIVRQLPIRFLDER